MPVNYVRGLTATVRTRRSNTHLGIGLAFVAGATNAGGFLAVQQYTSHMTGIVSSMAEAAIGGDWFVLSTGGVALAAFLIGAATTAILVNAARQHNLRSAYALPLLLEALLLLLFGTIGARLNEMHELFVPLTVVLLCFIMGLQNAVITKISHAEIRTTHVTGLVTDIGIEVGKLLLVNRPPHAVQPPVVVDRERLLLLLLFSGFFSGGVVGAAGFRAIGFAATVPLALVVVALALIPVIDDLRRTA
ncbi:DUF1275 domain-containing protein [Synechococcus sp. L2F]|uniref:YoaK family protein n=1 Tax=Synechococcus sp. L2F TaxID=2823739 RepID=UPI0020CCEBAC|nr:YoaK family protein [Synechococcus sp. L2F]MCP9827333.1 DUF1275 domain-containing protein [Synechococcus sp. L2F]